ncbi:LytR/AlgR family response regulator transcription factor [Shewanella donghaensis]|uniref:LytR/AlgR family response regulator transcription factor n=1 Tax=Shewanella donghaensis TaxID=238836 RepID=UPI0011821465|nr:LytTR family DNA-binding domain-containing protein [Shewanella donghaensis]
MTKLAHFQKYKLRYEMAILCCYFLINNTLLATSIIMEADRKGTPLPFQVWEPFVWEYSSAIGVLVLFPLLIYSLQRIPFEWTSIKRSVLYYFLISVVFSLCHVAIMVGIRESIYFVMNSNYDFGNIGFELFYEYRKDLWSFIFFIIFINAYQFILSRLQGEANPVAQSEDDNISQSFDRLLIKKLGKEFIVKVEEVEWLEANGNYVNLHINGRIYPTRTTLSKLIEKISTKGFCRIHRSHAVNLEKIESITPLSSGDSEVKLNSGKALNLSRRYKESFKTQLG